MRCKVPIGSNFSRLRYPPMKSRQISKSVQFFANRGCLSFACVVFSLQFLLSVAGCGSKNTSNNLPATPSPAAVLVSPQSVPLQVSTKQQFAASVSGLSSDAVTWTASGGTITSAGLYTAPTTAGTFTVTATSQSDSTKSDSATVTVSTNPPAPTPTPTPVPSVSVTISPSIISLGTSGTQQFSATVKGTTNTAVTWTASGGSISSSGLFTAQASAGTDTVTVTSAADPTKSATAQVLVGGAGTTLAQAAASVTPGVWFHFTAAENTSWNGGALLNLAATHTGTDNATAWSTKGLWNPVTKEFYFVGGGHCGSGNSGCPGTQMVLRYSDSTNTWNASYRDGGHTYEGATINTTPGANNDVFMRLYSSTSINTYDIASQAWASTSIASVPNGSDCCLAMEYFPDRNSLITVDNDYGVYEYSFSTGKWGGCLFGTSSSVGCPNGTHNFCGASSTAAPWERYDPVNHRMLLGGCSNVFALSSSLALTQLSSAPFSISVGTTASPVTIDPGTGKLIS